MQFFRGNYGSALGDTRTAANLIAQAGATQGQMLNNLGAQLGGAISSSLDKFRLNKEKKEKEQRAENQFLNLYEGNPENPIFKNLGIQSTDEAKAVAKDISKDPQLIQQAMKFAQFATVQQQAQEASQVRNLQKQQLRQSMEGQKADRLRAELARQKEEAQAQIYDQFLGSREMVDMQLGGTDTNPLMRNVTGPTTQVPQGEYKGNRFLQTEQGKSDFTSLVDAGMDRSDALATAGKFEAQLLANQPKQMTPEEKASYEKTLLENEGLRIKNLQAEDKLDKTLNPPIGDESYTGSVLEAVDGIYDLLDNGPKAKGPVTGFGAETTMSLGGSNAANANALIKTIMSDVAFSRLQKMRNDSPTGGALGQVSNIELDLLKSAMGSLDQRLSPPLFRKNLDSIKKHYDNFMRSIQARKLAAQQGLKFKTTEEAISWMDKNVPMGGKPAPDNQTNVTTPGGFSIRKN